MSIRPDVPPAPSKAGSGPRGLAVVRETGGSFTLDAEALAQRFGWPPDRLRDLMRRGLVTSVVERGEAADQGRWRLSVHCGNRRWQAVVDPDGTVAAEHVEIVSRRQGQPASSHEAPSR